jgi:hypothetical protein
MVATPAPFNARYGAGRHADIPTSSRSAVSTAGRTLVDLVLIALVWAIFIGVMLYPAAQLVGLIACAIALVFAGRRRPAMAMIQQS